MLGAVITRPADDPAALLKRNFESAKSALASGDLPEAERQYHQTIALGLRQVANISVSESRFEEATREFDQVLKFAPAARTSSAVSNSTAGIFPPPFILSRPPSR